MDCETILPLISRYITGELSELDVRKVRNHLESCSLCREDYQFQTAIEQSLKDAGRIPMPRTTELRILARLPFMTGWQPPMYAVAAAGIFLGVLIGLWSYIINAHIFQPVIDMLLTMNAEIWAWAGNNIPELFYLFDYLPKLSLIQVILTVTAIGFMFFKLFKIASSSFSLMMIPVLIRKRAH